MPSKKKATKTSEEWNIGDEVLCKTGQLELKYEAKITDAVQYSDHLVYTVKYKGYRQTEDIPHVLALDRFSRLTPESKAQAANERNVAKKQEKRAKSTSGKKRQNTRKENIDARANNETEAVSVMATDAFEFEPATTAGALEDLPMLPIIEQFHVDENIHVSTSTSSSAMGTSSSAIVTNEFSSKLGQAANVSENDDLIRSAVEQLYVDNYNLTRIRLTGNLVALLKREESFVNQYLPAIPARVSVETMLKKFCDVQIFRNLHNGYHLGMFKDDFLQMFDSFDWKKMFTDFEGPMFEDFFSGKSAYQGISSLKPKWVTNAEGNNNTGSFTFSSQLGITYLVRFLAKFHYAPNKHWNDSQKRAFKSYADAFVAFVSEHMKEFFNEIDDVYPISIAYYERAHA